MQDLNTAGFYDAKISPHFVQIRITADCPTCQAGMSIEKTAYHCDACGYHEATKDGSQVTKEILQKMIDQG